MNRTVVSIIGIAPVSLGSSESWCRELSRQLSDQGWTSVLCFLAPPSPKVRAFLESRNVVFDVVRNSDRGDVQSARDFRRVVRRYRPSVVHLHFTGFIGPYPWLARLSGVPYVFFTDQGSRPVGFIPTRAPFWKRAAARAINLPLDTVVCVSEYCRRAVDALDLLPSARYTRIYNSVDLARIDAASRDGSAFRRRFDIPHDAPLIAQVSWQIPDKGIPDLLEAARLVIDRQPNVWLALVGEGTGSHRRDFEILARRLGIARQVVWTGVIEDPIADGVFAAADVVCQVSRWEEAFGWVIPEAMAFEKPVVATRVGGIPELVSDGRTGFLVERGDTQTMAARILSLLDDPALRTRFGRAGRSDVEDRFDLCRNVAAVLALYGAR